MTESENQFLTPFQAIQKSLLRQPVDTKLLEKFRAELEIFLNDINPENLEESNKGSIKTFLESTHWKTKTYRIDPINGTDLVIKDKSSDKVVVMFEFKKVGSPEMISIDKLNRKSLQELVLYYVLEEFENNNTSIRQLIVSDGYQYFIFDKGIFWKLFGKDRNFVNEVLAAEHNPADGREYIYQMIIKPKINQVIDNLLFTYINLSYFTDKISDSNIIDDRKFNAAYKLFSPTHLLNLQFSADHNTLNNNFYKELLYIMGLEEVSEHNFHKIKRIKDGGRQTYSLFEQTYSLLDDYYFETENDRIETALELVVVWTNRILFMKLLESQLVLFNSQNNLYAFMRDLPDFNTIHYLFCMVLATPEDDRSDEMKEKFKELPYLNSSLFEISEIEKKYFPISSLRNGLITIMKSSVLKDRDGKMATGDINILSYILRFLDSFDFGSDGGKSGKTIINASVLGLIFEKINGYKDGSFFTPGYVSSYICRETIRKTIVQKFNDERGWNCADFEELKDAIDFTKREERNIANDIINRVRICDPAVGSGHFLVSALNELIAIKRELNVLQEADGSRFRAYNIGVEDDELVVSDEDGEFKYCPNVPESQRVQEMLFEEKKTIIENCLFGVDINPKSVEICQLRLWIELLKNAYYLKNESGKRYLRTLPNIDIKIKRGNSLVMIQPLDTNIKQFLAKANLTLEQYFESVKNYKSNISKANKHKINNEIHDIKNKISREFMLRSQHYEAWLKAHYELILKENPMFPDVYQTKEIERLRQREKRLRDVVDDITKNNILVQAFEWRYEFPEILDESGNFTGFDCVIGNPPYGVSISGEYRKKVEEIWSHVPDYEIYYYFIELAHSILKKDGLLAYIIPNTWLFNVNSESYRLNLLRHWNIQEVLDCTSFQIFNLATVRNSIVTMQKVDENTISDDDLKNNVVKIGYKNTKDIASQLPDDKSKSSDVIFKALAKRKLLYIGSSLLINDFRQNWSIAFCITEKEKNLIAHICKSEWKISDFFNVSQGYIPYRLSDLVNKYGQTEGEKIKENRSWHSKEKIDETYFQEIYGENVSKYSYQSTGEYVKYGNHVGTFVDMKYFNSPRILVREIVNPLIACYIEETFINDPQLINIIKKEDNTQISFKLLWAVLNSKLANFFVINHSPKATKGCFPKILIADINGFPLPKLDSEEKKKTAEMIETLVEKVTEEVKKFPTDSEIVRQLEWQIDSLVFELYGLSREEITIVDSGFYDN